MPTNPTLQGPHRHHGRDRFRAMWRRGGRQYSQWFDTDKASVARKMFSAWLRQWKSDPRLQDPRGASGGLTTAELCQRYVDHAETTYRKDGKPTSHVFKIKAGLQTLADRFGRKPASELTPPDLAAWRDGEVKDADGKPRCRSTINAWLGIIKAAWAWAAEVGLLDAQPALNLRIVRGLMKGRSKAAEPTKVTPVAKSVVTATARHCSPQIRAMVWLQWWTGMRPDEVCRLRPADVERPAEAKVWHYRPAAFKTDHHEGASRIVSLGPRAQAVLRPWLDQRLELTRPVFRPSEAASATGSAGGRYNHNSYRRAVQRACKRAGVPEWSPNQLRHARATAIRQEQGLEAARAVLGHSKTVMTENYAQRDVALADQVAIKTG